MVRAPAVAARTVPEVMNLQPERRRVASLTTAVMAAVVAGIVTVSAVAVLSLPGNERTSGHVPGDTLRTVSSASAAASGMVPATTVPPANVYANTIAESCAGVRAVFNDFAGCLDEALFAAMDAGGPGEALRSLRAVMAVDEDLSLRCHDRTHIVGRWTGANTADLTEALSHDDGLCQFGYMHGVMEGATEGLEPSEFIDMAPTLCDSYAGNTNLDQCTHATGHGAANVISDDVYGALRLCDSLGDSYAQDCAGGVLMEYGNSWRRQVAEAAGAPEVKVIMGSPGTSMISADDARHLCEQVPGDYSTTCYQRLSSFWGPELGDDFTTFFARCLDVEAPLDRQACGYSAGEWANGRHGKPGRAQAVGICVAGPGEVRTSCYQGIADSGVASEVASGGTVASMCPHVPATDTKACTAIEDAIRARIPTPTS